MAGFGEDGEGLRLEDGGASGVLTEELRRLRAEMAATEKGAEALAGSISGSLRGAFDRMVVGGSRASDLLRSLGRDLVGRTFDAAIRPVHGALTQGLTSAIGGLLAGAVGGGAGVSPAVTAFAEGGVLSAGRARAFASGGVVERPTGFAMRGGLGLMGEAGPEAILPLRRGADGRLGVAAGGGGGGVAPRVTVNVATPDVAGFEKSRSQVAAQVARAVRRGARHG